MPKDLEGIEICLTMLNGTTNPLGKFRERMDDPLSLHQCPCLPDCEEIVYETQENNYSYLIISCYKAIYVSGGH